MPKVNGKLVLNDYKSNNIFSIKQKLEYKDEVNDFYLALYNNNWEELNQEDYIYTSFDGIETQYKYYQNYRVADSYSYVIEKLKTNSYYLLIIEQGGVLESSFIVTPGEFLNLKIFSSQKIERISNNCDIRYEILIPTQKGTLIQGQYTNEENIENYAHVVGNGISDFDRKNIYTLDWDGNAAFAGDIKLKTIEEKHTWINESTQYNFKPYFNYMTFNDTSSSLNLNNLNAKNPSSNNVYYHKIFFTLSSTIGAIGGSKIENYYYFGNLVCTYIPTGAGGGAGGWTESDVLALYNQNTNTVEVWTSQRLDIDIENISTLYFNVSKIASNAELETNISLKQTIQDLQSRIAALEAKINS